MKLRRTPIAFLLTVAWLLGAASYAWVMRDAFIAMTPVQFAEFLAGAFSPLAFLWLIVGYMQQGQELELNTRALVQQADELKHSAEQQRLLVEVTREQLAEERTNIQLERERIMTAAEPVFLIGTIGNPGAGQITYPIRLANSGGTARALSLVTVTPEGAESRLFTLPVLETGSTHDFNLPLRVVQHDSLRFTYRDMYGTRGSKTFSIQFAQDNALLFNRTEG